MERGDRNPSLDTIAIIAAVIGLSLPELLNETDNVTYLNAKEQALVEYVRKLPDAKADALLAFLKTLS